jgi:hypothetical protein
MKNKLLLLAMGFAMTTQMILAQVPSYVPTNGLIGYYPFNGNANDESTFGNNGTVNGSTLISDRFGNPNSAYNFNGTNDTIKTTYVQTNITAFSISAWFKTSLGGPIVAGDQTAHCITLAIGKQPYDGINTGKITFRADGPAIAIGQITNSTYLDNNWHHVVGVYTGSSGSISGSQFQIYVDNILATSSAMTTGGVTAPLNNTKPTIFGAHYNWSTAVFNGSLDDIGIWNRALTQDEITSLYYSENSCQSLVINTGILGFNPVTYNNTVTIYPNPANDHITIDCGNLGNVPGWNIKIYNTLGQEVFSGAMNQQQYTIPLNTWGGQGVYFVKIYDASNNVVNTKKIILQ